VRADLKADAERAAVLALVDQADVRVEGYRPGVAERLGVGPQVCCGRNPGLVYGRMTGWGQDGPLARTAGHDINYIALTGALAAIGTAGEPVPPLNLVGDYGGGSMFLLAGVLAALVERATSGVSQVVDAAMVDGASVLLQGIQEMRAQGAWRDVRASNLIDGGAPYYRTYACADGRHMAVGAIEPKFYAALLDGLGLDPEALPEQDDELRWDELADAVGDVFRTRPRDDWAALFAGTDACATPVLEFAEASGHPHIAARGSQRTLEGGVVAGPAPRFSRSTGTTPPGGHEDLAAVTARWSDAVQR